MARTTCLSESFKKKRDLRLLIHECVNHEVKDNAQIMKIKQDYGKDLKPRNQISYAKVVSKLNDLCY